MPASGTAFGPGGKKRLGPYQILSPLGKGGMGQVYLASDTRLERTVAIKVLPEHLSNDPDRRERFEREAKAISSLNHPHICTLYDVGEQDGTHFIVMEYVEGETLERRLQKGKLPLDEALRYAIQITDALDRAHRKGIVHRDLKPGNIMLTGSGVKLLDFGLAKLKSPTGTVSQVSEVVTETEDGESTLTVEGTILGTLQYMAPEQLEGKDADVRSDIFALGSVVYEMVTGRKAFSGDSQASLISGIMSGEPEPVSKLEPMAPKALDHFVRTCLEKAADNRWQTSHDVKVQLKWIQEGESELLTDPQGVLVQRIVEAQVRAKTRLILRRTALAMLALIVLAGLAGWFLRNPVVTPGGDFVISAPPSEPVRLSGTTTELTVSPDGSLVVYGVVNEGQRSLYLRSVDEPEGEILPVGTASTPFFSAGGEWIGFNDLADGSLKMISTVTRGGRPQVIGGLEGGTAMGADWGVDGNVVFATSDNSTGLVEIPSPGGTSRSLTTPGTDENHLWPDILPNGRFVLFTIRSGYANTHIAVLDVETLDFEVLDQIQQGTRPRYARGHIVYAVGSALWAIPFDADRGVIPANATPFQVQEGLVSTLSGAAPYDISDDGALVFVWGEPLTNDRLLAWVDRDGQLDFVGAEARPYLSPRISPDETLIAVQTLEEESGASDIWIQDASGNADALRLTLEGNNIRPIWRPTGESITFASDREGTWGIYSQEPASTQATLLLMAPEGTELWPESWSPDGDALAYIEITGEDRTIRTARIDGEDVVSEEFYDAEGYQEGGAMFSPDGSRLAYYSNEQADFNIYVHTVPSTGAPRRVTDNGGVFPLWLENELFYRRPSGAPNSEGTGLIARDVVMTEDQPFFRGERILPIPGYATITTYRNFDITRDGERFLMVFPSDRAESEPGSSRNVRFIQNWSHALESR